MDSNMKSRTRKRAEWILVLGSLLIGLAGCDGGIQPGPGQAAVSLPVPQGIRQVSQFMGNDPIAVVVTINGSIMDPVPVTINDTGGSSIVVNENELNNGENSIDIVWQYTTVDERDDGVADTITLASYIDGAFMYDRDASEPDVSVVGAELVYSGSELYDPDGDTIWSLDELLNVPRTSPVRMDSDADNQNDNVDNCPVQANQGQENDDEDMLGNACDNCFMVGNPNQENSDDDADGDACDEDDDNDGFNDAMDNCPLVSNDDQRDIDGDDIGNACEMAPGLSVAPMVDQVPLRVGDVPYRVVLTGMDGNNSDGVDFTFQATSNRPDVASVTEDSVGRYSVSPLTEGMATIMFTALDQLGVPSVPFNLTINVDAPLSQTDPMLVLNSSNRLQLGASESQTIRVMVNNVDSESTIVYSPEIRDPTVASVADTIMPGVFTVSGLSAGSTVVTVSATVDGIAVSPPVMVVIVVSA